MKRQTVLANKKSKFPTNTQVPKAKTPIINPTDYGKIVFGLDQKDNAAPMRAPAGFTTQVPYNSAINSTIIANPNTIPLTTCYQVFETDSVVHSSIMGLILNIINRIKDYRVPGNEEAQFVANKCLETLGKAKVINHTATGLIAGFSTAKMTEGVVEGYTMWDTFIALPPTTILLAVTPDGFLDDTFGVLHYYYNVNSNWNQAPMSYSPEGNGLLASFGSQLTPQRQTGFNALFLSPVIKENRFFFTFNPGGMAGNFYGTSLINSIYPAVTFKNAQLATLERAAMIKAVPLLAFLVDQQGTVTYADGRTASLSTDIAQTLPDALKTGAIVINSLNGVKIERIDNTADLKAMQSPIDWADDQIRIGLMSTNATNNSGSYANAMANASAQTIMHDNIVNMIADAIRDQIVIPAIKMALPPKKQPEDYGYFEIVDNSIQNRLLNAQLNELNLKTAIFNPTNLEDYNLARNRTGYPPKNELTKEDQTLIATMMNGGINPNMMATKMAIEQPYAQGDKDVQDDHYT